MMEGKKIESHEEGSLRLKCFSPLKILTSLLFEVTLGAFFPFSFSSFFYAPSLEDSVVLMIFVEKITPLKTSFQMA
jgi:hypothetical protein